MPAEEGDCISCRLISGFGIIGMGAYIYYQAKRRKNMEKFAMNALSVGAVSIGVARLLNMKFLKSKKDGQ